MEEKIFIEDWDYFGINEINLIVKIGNKKFSGCLTELN